MKGGYSYSLYGLVVRSNREIPFLTPAPLGERADLEVRLPSERRQPPASWNIESVSADLTPCADGGFLYRFSGDGEISFEIGPGASRVTATWGEASLFEELCAFLVGPVLACVLRLRGIVCLHACVAQVGEACVAILGEKGAGKSTTAAALAARGHAILSDDVAVLRERDGQWFAAPGYPRLRLWPDAARALTGAPISQLTRVLGFSEKRFVDLTEAGDWAFQSTPLPLMAIYLLQARRPGAEPSIVPLSPSAAVPQLMAHRSVRDLRLSREGLRREFASLGRIASRVSAREVVRGVELEALPEIGRLVAQDALTHRATPHP